jgi:hypothetical protein
MKSAQGTIAERALKDIIEAQITWEMTAYFWDEI